MPLALMTIRSLPGTRADTFPLVHATSPLRGSSACSSQSSARTSAMRSPTDGLHCPDVAQLVHHIVAATAEVVVQPAVAGVELVVDVRRSGVRQVGVTALLAHHGRRLPDVGVAAGGDGRVDGRAERRTLLG